MIISASRRTDIPAWHGNWFLNRLRAGEVLVRNPYRPTQITRIPLSPRNVDCIVFWSKNPSPMLPMLSSLEDMGYVYYFQFTLTPYGNDLEPGLPEKEQLLQTFLQLCEQLGPQRVIWRYDPVIVSRVYPVEYHIRAFERTASALKGKVKRCVFSFFDYYPFLGTQGKEWAAALTPSIMDRLAFAFSQTASSCGIELCTCAEERDFSRYGIHRGACIDRKWIENLLSCPLDSCADMARPQRPFCSCMESVDIGAYGTCGHGCLYCYAKQGKRMRILDEKSPLLDGFPNANDLIRTKDMKSLRTPKQLSFFPSSSL